MYSKTIALIFISAFLLVSIIWSLYYSGYTSSFLFNSPNDSNESHIMQNALNANEPNKEAVIAKWYAPLVPIKIGNIELLASVADTEAERGQGLSGTPYIPEEIVKLFVFETSGTWGFWMKDMNYPIDILWLDANKQVIHIEESLSPSTYPQSFVPKEPALYVVETKSGFVAKHKISLGTSVVW